MHCSFWPSLKQYGIATLQSRQSRCDRSISEKETLVNRLLAVYKSPTGAGFVLNVITVWFALAASFLLLAWSGSSFGVTVPGGPKDAPWTPPGAVIGAVWCGLYTLMGTSLWALSRLPSPTRGSLQKAVLFLIGFCLVWPFYAFDARSRWPGLLGNMGILLIALYVVWKLWPTSRTAALMIAPVAVWITIATASIVDGARHFGW